VIRAKEAALGVELQADSSESMAKRPSQPMIPDENIGRRSVRAAPGN
jgi:hypothetical protein